MPPVSSSRPSGGILAVPDPRALRSLIEKRYQCLAEELTIAGTRFSLLRVADTNALLETIDPATFAEDERLPYWSEIWASSVHLAHWCLTFPGLREKRVLELGCGLGLAGIAAARAGATVVLSDYEQDALLFARYNAMQNISGTDPEVLLFDWRRPSPGRKFDIVLGADILYDRQHFLPLLEAFGMLLSPGGIVVLTDPDRSTGDAFAALAPEWGYHVSCDRAEIEHHERSVSINRYELRRLPGIAPEEAQR